MMINLLFLIPLIGASMGFKPRIVGGTLARPGEIPYQVSLQDIKTDHHFCGAVILNEQYVLTAAHCLVNKNTSKVSVNVGMTNLRKPHSIHLIESSYIHEEYDPTNSWINDIALIKLKSPFSFSSLVSAVKLPRQNETTDANTVTIVSGFGRLWQGGMGSTELRVVNIIVADQTFCREQYGANFMNIYDTQICAYDPTEQKGSCQGDSGGPLTANGKLIGLVSWSNGCADTEFPSVFTRVSSYIDWIKEHTA